MPKATGRLLRPSAVSPSMDLKSLTMAMPRPASEYSTVSTTTVGVSVSTPNMACPHHHGRAMYDDPRA